MLLLGRWLWPAKPYSFWWGGTRRVCGQGTSEPSKAAVNPAPGPRLWDQNYHNVTTQDTDLPLSLPVGPNSCLVTSVLALRRNQHLVTDGIKLVENIILHPPLRLLGRCLWVFPL